VCRPGGASVQLDAPHRSPPTAHAPRK
jgi:hypothetical protein